MINDELQMTNGPLTKNEQTNIDFAPIKQPNKQINKQLTVIINFKPRHCG